MCIYRLPKGKSIIRPGSACPGCNHLIAWYDNIPVLSFVLLKGKCRNCKAKISMRYPLVEGLTGVLFGALAYKFPFHPVLFVYLFFTLSLIIVSFIDLDTFLISDAIVIPAICIGLVCSVAVRGIFGSMGRLHSLLYSFEGILLGGLVLVFLALLGTFMLKKDAMGGGDIKLLAMIGAFLGWKSIFISLFFASLIGTAITLVLVSLKIRKIHDYIPFGPYLALGAIIAMFWKGYTFLGFFIP